MDENIDMTAEQEDEFALPSGEPGDIDDGDELEQDSDEARQIARVTRELMLEIAANLPNGAFVPPTVRMMGVNIQIGPRAIISDYAVIYDNTVIGADSYIGPHAVIGAPNASGYSQGATVVMPNTAIGTGAVIESGVIAFGRIGHRAVVTRNNWKQRALRFGSLFRRGR